MKIRLSDDWLVILLVMLGAVYGALQFVFVFEYFFGK